jgi:polyisoprenoid-binding protein YceI
MLASNRARLISLAIAGGLGLAVIAVGAVYFLLFPTSSPKPLAITSTPSSSSSATTSATSSDPAGSWTVASGSQAGYRVRETLASVGAPSDAVGRTSSVHGTVTIIDTGTTSAVSAASLTVDVNTLTSDRSMRDQRIHSMGLQSDRYPQATFVLTSPIPLPANAGSGQIFNVSAVGQLTIHGVTKTVTIPMQVKVAGSQAQIAGSITFPFSDYGMTPPSIGGFVSVQNNATMEFALNLLKAI